HRGCGLKRSRKDMGGATCFRGPGGGSPACGVDEPRTRSTDWLSVRFLGEPLGDLFAGPEMIVVQVDDHRGQRQPLVAARGALLRHLVEASEQPLEMIRDQLPFFTRQVVHTIVDGAERTGAALVVEVTAE